MSRISAAGQDGYLPMNVGYAAFWSGTLLQGFVQRSENVGIMAVE
jgi:hypothetical protein